MIRRPPSCPFFPSTPLFRSSVEEGRSTRRTDHWYGSRHCLACVVLATSFPPWRPTSRSEEHTSELQSRQYRVCRLLLEKKKKTRYPHELTPNSSVSHRRKLY